MFPFMLGGTRWYTYCMLLIVLKIPAREGKEKGKRVFRTRKYILCGVDCVLRMLRVACVCMCLRVFACVCVFVCLCLRVCVFMFTFVLRCSSVWTC